MNVSELIELLEDMPEDAEVRIAHQPSWPFQLDIGEVIGCDLSKPCADDRACTDCGDTDCGDPDCNPEINDDDGESNVVVYIVEAGQHRGESGPYLPGIVAEELGWKE